MAKKNEHFKYDNTKLKLYIVIHKCRNKFYMVYKLWTILCDKVGRNRYTIAPSPTIDAITQ